MAPREFERDKRWADRFLPEMKRIIGEHLIGEAPSEEDQERNTDLIVLRLDAVRIACRVRKHNYYARYGDEFTIRTSRPSGVKTELAKVMEGYGDYILYGFSDPMEDHLYAWMLGNLNVFRLTVQQRSWKQAMNGGNSQPPIGTMQQNADGSSGFMSFRLDELPKSFIVARNHPERKSGRLLIHGKEVA